MGRVIMMRPIIVFFITIIAKKTEVLNPFKEIHGQFTAICVHKRKRIGKSLPSSRPIPKLAKKNAATGRERLFVFNV